MAHLQPDPLDLASLLTETSGVDAGAVVVFMGDVRAQDAAGEIVALDYDAHPALAAKALARIEADALTRPGVLACRILHRTGLVPAGETSVIAVVRARHRAEAFDTARDAIERLKREVAIWKEDVLTDGSRRTTDPGQPIEAGKPPSARQDPGVE